LGLCDRHFAAVVVVVVVYDRDNNVYIPTYLSVQFFILALKNLLKNILPVIMAIPLPRMGLLVF